MTDRRKTIISAIILVLVIAAVALIWKFYLSKEKITTAIEFIRSFGGLAMVVFLLTYIALVPLSFPTSLLNIASGIIFGIWAAIPLSLAGAICGASLAFYFSRYVLKDQVKGYLNKFDSTKQVMDMTEEHGWRLVAMLRINPMIPAVLKNYGFGLTNISFKQYFFASLLGQAPITTFYTYLGWISGRSMLDGDSETETYQWIILGIGALVSFAAMYWAYRYKSKHSQKA